MRVTIDVDESLWEEIMNFIISRYKKSYGIYRKKVINEILKVGLKVIKKGNFNDVLKVLESYEVGDEFLNFMDSLSKSIRERGVRREWNYA